MAKDTTRDLTTGTPVKVIISFGIPILLGDFLQQAYNIADLAIVGKFVSVEALAGVGSTTSLYMMIIGFLLGTCTGFSIPMSQSFGAKDYDRLRKYYANSIWISLVIAVLFTSLTLIYIDPILRVMQTPDNMYEHAKTYISTIFAGIPGIFLYNLLSSVLRSVGDSKTPVYFLLGSSVVNIVLDVVFVVFLSWGVFGTGLATIISQAIAGIFCWFYIKKRFPVLQLSKEDWKLDMGCVKDLFFIGIPMGLQFSIIAIGSIVMQAAVNTLGHVYCAAITAGQKINYFAVQGLNALGAAMATYSGQNLGAGKIDRINKGVIQSVILGCAYSVVAFSITGFGSYWFSLIFVSTEEVEIIESIGKFLKVNAACSFLLVAIFVFRNTIQGLGYSGLAMFAGVAEMIARSAVALGLVSTMGYNGALLANPFAYICADLFLVPAYIFIYRRIKARHNAELRVE